MVNRISISRDAYQERSNGFIANLKAISPIKFDKFTPEVANELLKDDKFLKVRSNYVTLKHAIHSCQLLADKQTEFNSKSVSIPKTVKF